MGARQVFSDQAANADNKEQGAGQRCAALEGIERIDGQKGPLPDAPWVIEGLGTDLRGPCLLCDMAMQMVMGFKATILTSTERCVAMQKSAKEMECAVVSKPPMMNVPISARSCGSSSALPVDHAKCCCMV